MYRFRISDRGQARIWPIPKDVILIGSGPEADLALAGADIPPIALRLSLSGDAFAATACEARSAPLCNGARAERAELRVGDLLELGGCLLRLESDSRGEGDAPPTTPGTALRVPSAYLPRVLELCGGDTGTAIAMLGAARGDFFRRLAQAREEAREGPAPHPSGPAADQ